MIVFPIWRSVTRTVVAVGKKRGGGTCICSPNILPTLQSVRLILGTGTVPFKVYGTK